VLTLDTDKPCVEITITSCAHEHSGCVHCTLWLRLTAQASACSALEQQWSTYSGRRALRAYEKSQLQQWKQSHPSTVLSATSAALAATLALSPKHMLTATFGSTFDSTNSISSSAHRKGSVAPTSAQRYSNIN
jgi:hypothetical protein